MRASFLAAPLLGLALPLAAQVSPSAPPTAPAPKATPPTRVYRATRASGPIRVDAILDEEAWAKAETMELPVETFPGDNIPAPVRTEGLVLYDDKYLYVAFRAFDPEPRKIRAHLSDRDKAFSDDFVGIVIDTFNDERRAFEFFVNPLGVQMDLFQNDVGGNEDETYDAIWDSAGRITSEGYIVELAISFSSLRFHRASGEQTWGVDMVRIYPRSQRHRIGLQPLSRDRNCYVCQFSKMTGLEGITPGRNLEFDPTVTAQRNDTREDFPDGPLESGGIDVEPGLTARWGITPNLTLNAAINPDFSQIEADAAQLDINTQFALFFPEKRPFFLEGADFFTTPLQVVYTRTVAEPEWGLKLTGKEGKHAIGFFLLRDKRTNLILPGSQGSALTSLAEENLSGVLRYRYDVGKNSTVGVLYTGRESEGSTSSHLAGLDAFIRVTPRDSLRAQVLGSRTRYTASVVEEFGEPPGTFEDRGFHVDYRHSTRNWFWRAAYTDLGEDFRADAGFLPQVGYRQPVLGLERTWWGEKGAWYSRFFLGGDWDRTQEQSGQVLEEEFEAYFGIGGPLQSFLFLDVGVRDRFFNGASFDQTFLNFEFDISPTGDFRFGFDGTVGDHIDFAHTRAADRFRVAPYVRYNAGRHLRLDFNHTFESLDVEGGRLFTANLSEFRAVYQFNIRTFVRAILQYTDVARDQGLHASAVEPESTSLFTQLLFSYKINPQTVFFLGYSDNRDGDHQVSLTQRNRTLFAKVGYAWIL